VLVNKPLPENHKPDGQNSPPVHGLRQNYTEEEAGPSSAPERQSLKACTENETKCHEKWIFLNKTLPPSERKCSSWIYYDTAGLK